MYNIMYYIITRYCNIMCVRKRIGTPRIDVLSVDMWQNEKKKKILRKRNDVRLISFFFSSFLMLDFFIWKKLVQYRSLYVRRTGVRVRCTAPPLVDRKTYEAERLSRWRVFLKFFFWYTRIYARILLLNRRCYNIITRSCTYGVTAVDHKYTIKPLVLDRKGFVRRTHVI